MFGRRGFLRIMARKAKSVTAGEAEQPLLFSVSALPEAPALVELAKTWERTGKVLGKDEQRLEDIVTDVLMRISKRKIALKYGVSRNSIDTCLEILTERGKLEPLKERLKVKIGRLAESSIDYVQELIDEGALPPQSAPIVMGVALDKKAQMDGDATMIVEHRTSGQQAADAWLEQFKALAGKDGHQLEQARVTGVTDCESPEKLLQVPANQGEKVLVTTLGTGKERKQAVADQDGTPDQGTTTLREKEGGGGQDGDGGDRGGGID
jgi:hypothetical protein